MKTIAASELQGGKTRALDEVIRAPVKVQKYGKDHAVLMHIDLYHELEDVVDLILARQQHATGDYLSTAESEALLAELTTTAE